MMYFFDSTPPFGITCVSPARRATSTNAIRDHECSCTAGSASDRMNQRDGTFQEEGLLRGVALDENGKALSGMGVAAGDYDNDGSIDLFREPAALHSARGLAVGDLDNDGSLGRELDPLRSAGLDGSEDIGRRAAANG